MIQHAAVKQSNRTNKWHSCFSKFKAQQFPSARVNAPGEASSRNLRANENMSGEASSLHATCKRENTRHATKCTDQRAAGGEGGREGGRERERKKTSAPIIPIKDTTQRPNAVLRMNSVSHRPPTRDPPLHKILSCLRDPIARTHP